MAKKNTPETKPTETVNNRNRVKQLIEAGGATRKSMLEAMGISPASLASNLSSLRTTAADMYESGYVPDDAKLYPVEGSDKIFYMGTKEDYLAHKEQFAGGLGSVKKQKTPEEVLAAAQKREDKASSAYANAVAKYNEAGNREHELRVSIAKDQLELASILLAKVSSGDYSSENVAIINSESVPTNAIDPAADEPMSFGDKGSGDVL